MMTGLPVKSILLQCAPRHNANFQTLQLVVCHIMSGSLPIIHEEPHPPVAPGPPAVRVVSGVLLLWLFDRT
jgi:hypothetical protein